MSNQSNQALSALYPFLHGNRSDPQQQQDSLLHSIHEKALSSVTVKQRFFAEQSSRLVDAARALAKVYQQHGRMFSMGNGGSSCDAAHFAVEFQHPVSAGRPALPAMCLGVDTAMLSAVANDVGIEHIFARQIDAHGQRGDGLIGFSTSGNSSNLLQAYRVAKDRGLITFGLCGGSGGEMLSSGLVDHCLVVNSDAIHRVQEVHVACYHILWDLTHTLLADVRGDLT